MGITVCRCCGGPIPKEEAAANSHICKSCEWLLDEVPEANRPPTRVLPEKKPATEPQAESSAQIPTRARRR